MGIGQEKRHEVNAGLASSSWKGVRLLGINNKRLPLPGRLLFVISVDNDCIAYTKLVSNSASARMLVIYQK